MSNDTCSQLTEEEGKELHEIIVDFMSRREDGPLHFVVIVPTIEERDGINTIFFRTISTMNNAKIALLLDIYKESLD